MNDDHHKKKKSHFAIFLLSSISSPFPTVFSLADYITVEPLKTATATNSKKINMSEWIIDDKQLNKLASNQLKLDNLAERVGSWKS